MENSNNEQYVYLLVIRTLGVDKTTFDYDVIPFKTLDAVNNAVLDDITNMAKTSKGEINLLLIHLVIILTSLKLLIHHVVK